MVMDDDNAAIFVKSADGAAYCYYCGTPDNGQRHGVKCPHFKPETVYYAMGSDRVPICVRCGSPENAYHKDGCPHAYSDPEPIPSDGPEYHADHQYWAERNISPGVPAVDALVTEDKPDMVNSPSHYTGPVPGIECIDVTRHFSLLRGTAIKYLWRADYKNNKKEDLKKAIWYIQKELDTLEDW